MSEPRPSDPRPANPDLNQPVTGLSTAFPFRRPTITKRPESANDKPNSPDKHPPRGR